MRFLCCNQPTRCARETNAAGLIDAGSGLAAIKYVCCPPERQITAHGNCCPPGSVSMNKLVAPGCGSAGGLCCPREKVCGSGAAITCCGANATCVNGACVCHY